MDKIKEKIKNIDFKKDILTNKVLWICLLIVVMFVGNFIRLEYSRCTYRMYTNPYENEYDHLIVIGRYFVAFFWKIVSILGLSVNQTYFISFGLGIFALTLSIYIFYNILKPYIKNNLLNILVSTGAILNCYFIDYFIYIEKGIFTLSILFCVIAIKYLVKFFENGKKRNLIYSFILLCLTSFSYQGTVALFIAVATIFIIKYSDTIKKFIYNNLITAGIYGMAMGISYILVRLSAGKSTSRTNGMINITESIKKIISDLHYMFTESYGTMPKYLFALTFILVFAIVVIAIYRLKDEHSESNKKSRVILLLGYIYVLAACVISAILPQLFIDTHAVSLAPRAIYSFASIIALSIIYLFMNKNIEWKNISNTFIVILFIFLGIQCYEYNRIIIAHYTINYVEKEYALSIGEHIKKYERENNIEVKNVVFYSDANSPYNYEDLKSYGSINERVFKTGCKIHILNYYLNRNFVELNDKNDEYEKEFKSVDYEAFNENALKFENETLHLCIY